MAKAKSKLDNLAAQLPPPELELNKDEFLKDAAPPPPAMEPQGPSEEFKVLCRVPVVAFGAAVTKYYKCPGLGADEIIQIATALAGVLHAHGLRVDDPRLAAWLTLGGAIAVAAQPRLDYIAEMEAAMNAKDVTPPEPEKKPDDVAA